MKRIFNTCLFLVLGITYCLCSAWGVDSWCVDPNNGDDSLPSVMVKNNSAYAYEHILKALTEASAGDSILLKSGDYNDEVISAVTSLGNTFIHVNKSIKMNRFRTNTPRIAGSYVGGPSTENLSLMLINSSSVTVKNVKFDGYNDLYNINTQPDSLLPHHVTIRITSYGSSTKIDNCEFKHMGRSLDTSVGVNRHEAIICSHPYPYSTAINNVQILTNTFVDNPFDTSHGHEVYLTKNSNAKIKYNIIHNCSVGVPLRFSNECTNAEIEYNNVYGAAKHGFIHDWENDGCKWCSGFIVNYNVFSDTDSSAVHADYEGPIISQSDSFNNRSAYVAEFNNNVIVDNDSLIFANDDAKAFKIYGVASDADTIYISVHRTDEDATRVYAFDEKNGPVMRPLYKTPDYEEPTNEICRTEDYIIVNTVNGSNNSLYKLHKNGSTTSQFGSTWAKSTREITALCLYTGDQFFVATIESGTTPKIFKGDISASLFVEIFDASSIDADEITAMTYDGSKVVFAVKDGNNTHIYSMDTDGTDDTNEQTFSTSTVPAMSCFNYKIYTACRNDGSNITTLYEGSYANPDSNSLSLSTTEISSIGGWKTSSDFLFAIKNVSNDGDKKLYFSDAPMTSLFQDVLYYSRWWKNY